MCASRQENINTFISAHCVLFVDREAFDHSHYGVFEDFKVMAEGLLEATLSSLGANADRFAKVRAASCMSGGGPPARRGGCAVAMEGE